MAPNLATPENIKSLAHFIGSKMFTPHWLELPDGGNKKNQLTRAASCLLEGGFKELGFDVVDMRQPTTTNGESGNGRKSSGTAGDGRKSPAKGSESKTSKRKSRKKK